MRKTILVVASVALAMVVLGGVAWAANIQCHGARGVLTPCKGTKKADRMMGDSGRNRMYGKKGGDTMYGRGNIDGLTGGPGSDRLNGGGANDGLLGQEGSDKLFGGDVDDELWGAGVNSPDFSNDYIHGQRGNDTIFVSRENLSHDYTHSGVDRIYGDMGDDEIFAAGNAEVGDSAQEIVDCGPGTDTVYFDEGVDIVDAATCERRFPQ
jgi:Ca2+-binding RTX toxin-like protein